MSVDYALKIGFVGYKIKVQDGYQDRIFQLDFYFILWLFYFAFIWNRYFLIIN